MKAKFLLGIATLGMTFTMLAGCDGPATCQHEWYDWEIDTTPTNTATGLAYRECELCGEEEEFVLPTLADAGYVKGRITATCEEPGKQYYTYTNEEKDMELEFKVNAPALGHDYVEQPAVDPTPTTLGHAKYHTCSRCDLIFDEFEEPISSLDDIAISYYDEIDADGHKHGTDEKLPHTYTEWQVDEEASILKDGSESRTCTSCGYKDTKTLSKKDIGTLNKDVRVSGLDIDGEFNSTGDNIYKVNDSLVGVAFIGGGSGMERLADGTITTGGSASSSGRVIVINTSGTVKMTMKGATGKSGTTVTFGEFDGLPNANVDNFKGTTCQSSTNSTDLFEFILEGAGVHYFGGNATLKVTWIEFEIHELDNSTWQKDATGHWHGNADPACTMRNDFADHTFGAWSITKAANASETGIFSRECSVCHYKEEITIPAGEHNWDNKFTSDASKHWVACTDGGCENKFGEADHTFVIDSKGDSVCSVCGYKDSSTIALYSAHVGQGDGDSSGFVAADNVFEGLSVTNTSGSYTTLDNPVQFTSISGGTITFTDGYKLSAASGKQHLNVSVPGACKVRIYAQCLASTNLRFATDSAFSTKENLNGDTKPENNALCTYERDIASASSFYLGISSADGRFVICGFEFIY